MKIDKTKRKEIYQQLLERVRETIKKNQRKNKDYEESCYICNELRNLGYSNIDRYHFPELIKFKRRNTFVWLAAADNSTIEEDNQLREVVLEFCIEMVDEN